MALKVIRAARSAEKQFLDRFLHEARVVASLDHPGILPVFDYGENRGLPFLVMPYLDGGTLRDRMDRPVPIADGLDFVRQLADALDAAHAAGVVHRDVKPANALFGKGNRLVLADFGIARLLEETKGLTSTGMVLGTPIYMAPEQAQGRPATAASDRYSLSAIAFEIVTGRPPFRGESALSLLHQHVSAPVPSVASFARGLPPGLDVLFRKALAKEPDARPATCRAFADELAAVLSGPVAAPVAARTASLASEAAIPPGDWESRETVGLRAPARASKRVSAFAYVYGVAGLIVVAGLGWILFRTKSEPAALPPAPAAAPTPSPTAPPATIAAPVVRVEELATPVVAPASLPPVSAAASRTKTLVTTAQELLVARHLTPPDPPKASEAIAALKHEAPGAREVPVLEGKLEAALKRRAALALTRGNITGAREDLLRAQALAPEDQQIRSLLKQTEPVAIQPTAVPIPGAAETLLAAYRSVVETSRSGHAPGEANFRSLREAARAARSAAVESARPFEIYASGGLEYLERKDAQAGQALVDAWRSVPRATAWEIVPCVLPSVLGRDRWRHLSAGSWRSPTSIPVARRRRALPGAPRSTRRAPARSLERRCSSRFGVTTRRLSLKAVVRMKRGKSPAGMRSLSSRPRQRKGWDASPRPRTGTGARRRLQTP